jgi:GNAT superfamily N-acetyltransferase
MLHVIRRVTSSDAVALRDVRLRALRDAPAAFLMTADQEEADPPERWTSLAARSAGGDDAAVFVDAAWRGMVGAMRSGGEVELWGLWVAPEARGTGLGAALVHAVIAWARAPVTLCVMDAQPALLTFYGGLGFVPAGEPRPLSSDPDRVIQSLRLSG